MSIADWSKKADTSALAPDDAAIAIRIEVHVEDEDLFGVVLADVKRDTVALVRRGETGVFEAQWCSSAARVEIARGGL